VYEQQCFLRVTTGSEQYLLLLEVNNFLFEGNAPETNYWKVQKVVSL